MKEEHNQDNPAQSRTMQTEKANAYLYFVRNPFSNEIEINASPTVLKRGVKVIAPTRYGLDYGVVIGPVTGTAEYEPGSTEVLGYGQVPTDSDEMVGELPAEVSWIERIATDDDERRVRENEQMEEEALRICREKVEYHRLEMKLVSAHYLFGEPKIIFFFTAANRVDFRELVKDLVSVFRIRIELRQIGVRDESRVLGGLAVCGRDFCCHAMTDKLNPVSIKMAKEQNLSLNSTKISGPCGRLLCCLSFEYDFYHEEKKKLPPEGSRFKFRQEMMRVSEVNLLSRKIMLTAPEGRFLTVPFEAISYNEKKSRWELDNDYVEEILSI